MLVFLYPVGLFVFTGFSLSVPHPHLALLSSNVCRGARMPRSYRLADEKKRAVAEYKRQIRAAVDGENYELAATLRDKIRALNDAK